MTACGILAVCLLAAGCARPAGDFGRAEASVVHDRLLPSTPRTGAAAANLRPRASFNLTDEEREMHDRVWRFLVAPHSEQWFKPIALRLQTHIAGGPVSGDFDGSGYYRWLSGARYESSRVRFNTLAYHAQLDIDTLPATFSIICRVEEIDRRRATASDALGGLAAAEQKARRLENASHLSRFAQALRYRYEAYAHALDHLLVETPHEEAREASARVTSLAIWVERASRADFCGGGALAWGGEKRDGPVPRVLRGTPGEGALLK